MPSRYIPKPKKKMMPCRYCDIGIEVGWKTKKSPAHEECSIKAASDAAIQMHEKSGPLYDKWREAMIRSFSE